MLKEMFVEMLNDVFSHRSPIRERLLGALVLLATLLTLAFLSLVLFFVVDVAWVTPIETTRTVVVRKELIPSYTTTTLVQSGNVSVPITNYFPESYYLHFPIDGTPVSSAVDLSFYNKVHPGDHIIVDYGYGRITGGYTPKRIELVSP